MPATRLIRQISDLDDFEGTPVPGQVLRWTGSQWQPTSDGTTTYVHTQALASDTWVISHGLGRHPSVSVVDSAANVVTGDVTYDSNNQVTVRFSAAFGGTAYLN